MRERQFPQQLPALKQMHRLPVTVIIPTYARPDRLRMCLTALSATEDIPESVIVVDDGSPQPVDSIVHAFTDTLNICCVRQSNAGPASARNRAASLAKTEFLAFTDDDCLAEKGWLSSLLEPLHTTQNALVGGRTWNTLAKNIFSEASQDLLSFIYDWAARKEDGFDFFASNNMACSKRHFDLLGGFDETFPLAAAEDRDFGLRWKSAGWPLIYKEDAVMGHSHELNLKKFWRQQSNYGKGASHLRLRIEERSGRQARFEGLKFYFAMQNFPFKTQKDRALVRSGLLLLSQLALTAGYLSDRVAVRR
jgi:GT2 family glycosyltransferase